jgi:hypothetical protein
MYKQPVRLTFETGRHSSVGPIDILRPTNMKHNSRVAPFCTTASDQIRINPNCVGRFWTLLYIRRSSPSKYVLCVNRPLPNLTYVDGEHCRSRGSKIRDSPLELNFDPKYFTYLVAIK